MVILGQSKSRGEGSKIGRVGDIPVVHGGSTQNSDPLKVTLASLASMVEKMTSHSSGNNFHKNQSPKSVNSQTALRISARDEQSNDLRISENSSANLQDHSDLVVHGSSAQNYDSIKATLASMVTRLEKITSHRSGSHFQLFEETIAHKIRADYQKNLRDYHKNHLGVHDYHKNSLGVPDNHKNCSPAYSRSKFQVQDSDLELNRKNLQLGYLSGPLLIENQDSLFHNYEMPKFDGKHPKVWISRMEKFFSFMNCAAADKMTLVSFCLEGEALRWFRREMHKLSLLDWTDFKKRLLAEFDLVQKCSPQEALLKQSISVEHDSVQTIYSSSPIQKTLETQLQPSSLHLNLFDEAVSHNNIALATEEVHELTSPFRQQAIFEKLEDFHVQNCSSPESLPMSDRETESMKTEMIPVIDQVTERFELSLELQDHLVLNKESDVSGFEDLVQQEVSSNGEESPEPYGVCASLMRQDVVDLHSEELHDNFSVSEIDVWLAHHKGNSHVLDELFQPSEGVTNKQGAYNQTIERPFRVTCTTKQRKYLKGWKFKFKKSNVQRHKSGTISRKFFARRNLRYTFFYSCTYLGSLLKGNNMMYWRLLRQLNISKVMCKMWLRQKPQQLNQITFGDGKFQVKHKWRFKQLKPVPALVFDWKHGVQENCSTKTATSHGKKLQVTFTIKTFQIFGNLGWPYMQPKDYTEADTVYCKARVHEPYTHKDDVADSQLPLVLIRLGDLLVNTTFSYHTSLRASLFSRMEVYTSILIGWLTLDGIIWLCSTSFESDILSFRRQMVREEPSAEWLLQVMSVYASSSFKQKFGSISVHQLWSDWSILGGNKMMHQLQRSKLPKLWKYRYKPATLFLSDFTLEVKRYFKGESIDRLVYHIPSWILQLTRKSDLKKMIRVSRRIRDFAVEERSHDFRET